jgi:predicted component of type VI protein secretion system
MNTTQEALEQMFHEGSEGYLGPVESVEEACRDLRIHQAATLKALQQARCEDCWTGSSRKRSRSASSSRAKSGGLLAGSQKARYWEMYPTPTSRSRASATTTSPSSARSSPTPTTVEFTRSWAAPGSRASERRTVGGR